MGRTIFITMNRDTKHLIDETIREFFESAPAKMVERGRREIFYDICPHCKTEIHERHEYTEDGGQSWRHSDCKGLISRSPTPIENLEAWARPYVNDAREYRKEAMDVIGGMPPSGEVKYNQQKRGGTMSAVNLAERKKNQ